MFHEDFIIDPKDDDPAGEYVDDAATLKFYLPHIYSISELINTIDHEWYHALFQYADEEEWSVDGDHFAMRLLGYS